MEVQPKELHKNNALNQLLDTLFVTSDMFGLDTEYLAIQEFNFYEFAFSTTLLDTINDSLTNWITLFDDRDLYYMFDLLAGFDLISLGLFSYDDDIYFYDLADIISFKYSGSYQLHTFCFSMNLYPDFMDEDEEDEQLRTNEDIDEELDLEHSWILAGKKTDALVFNFISFLYFLDKLFFNFKLSYFFIHKDRSWELLKDIRYVHEPTNTILRTNYSDDFEDDRLGTLFYTLDIFLIFWFLLFFEICMDLYAPHADETWVFVTDFIYLVLNNIFGFFNIEFNMYESVSGMFNLDFEDDDYDPIEEFWVDPFTVESLYASEIQASYNSWFSGVYWVHFLQLVSILVYGNFAWLRIVIILGFLLLFSSLIRSYRSVPVSMNKYVTANTTLGSIIYLSNKYIKKIRISSILWF